MRDGGWSSDFDLGELPTARTRATDQTSYPYPPAGRDDRARSAPQWSEGPSRRPEDSAFAFAPSDVAPAGERDSRSGASASGTRPWELAPPTAPTQPSWPDRAPVVPPTNPSANRKAKMRPKSRAKGPRYQRKGFVILAVVLLLTTALSALGAMNVKARYTQESQVAHDGVTHLQAGLTLLRGITTGTASAKQMAAAKQDFILAQSEFAQLRGTAAQIPGVATLVPGLGGKLSSAQRLLPLAETGAQAGILGSDALQTLLTDLENPLNPSSKGITQADLDAIGKDLAQAGPLLQAATNEVNQLQPSDLALDPRLGPAVAQFKRDLPKIQQAFQDAQTFLQAAPLLLGVGKPTNFLVELLDSTELRPGGGFVGNIGILTLSGGRLQGLHIKDVDLLDRPFQFAGGIIPMPAQYSWFTPLATDWSLRDSNLDANFPTDALNAEQNYKLEGGTDQVQGVIAITPWVIQKALAITGPIYVPEFNETITASNLVDRIHYHQLGPGHGSEYVPDPASLSSMRKRFTAFLFDHFMARVKAIQASSRGKFVRLLLDAFATKDVQVYFNDKTAESVLSNLNIASTIEAPPGGDSVFVVDANISGNKANNFISYHASDLVTLDASGTATHITQLQYSWPITPESQANDYGVRGTYSDYVRIYVPMSAKLINQQGWSPQPTTKAFGRLVFGGYLQMNFGSTVSITLKWTVPGAAVKTGTQWTYTLLRQRQAGVLWQLIEQVKLPSCATQPSASANLKPNTAGALSASLPLATDTNFSASYSSC